MSEKEDKEAPPTQQLVEREGSA